jgi:hypothetical protein
LRRLLSNCGRAFPDDDLLGFFMLVADAARAKIKALLLTIEHNDRRMDIRLPTAVGMALGVTDGITELRGFPTNIALQ